MSGSVGGFSGQQVELYSNQECSNSEKMQWPFRIPNDLKAELTQAVGRLRERLPNPRVGFGEQTPALTKPKGSARYYMKLYSLQASKEGGYFGVNDCSPNQVLSTDSRYEGKVRPASSSIYFLLKGHDFSAWHQLKSDEIWNYYDGSPINLYVIEQDGALKTYCLGNPTEIKGASFCVVIRAGTWFAADVRDKKSFGLAGCIVAPGFESEDFKLGDRETLIKEYPDHAAIICQFTRVDPVTGVQGQIEV